MDLSPTTANLGGSQGLDQIGCLGLELKLRFGHVLDMHLEAFVGDIAHFLDLPDLLIDSFQRLGERIDEVFDGGFLCREVILGLLLECL